MQPQDFIDPITDVIYRVILAPILKQIDEGKLTLIGFDYYGAILASVVGYKFNIPFTYCFREKSIVDEIEKEIQHINAQHILIITDVIVYGSTICKFVNNLFSNKGFDYKITVDVLTLFERKIAPDYFPKIYFQPRIRKIYVLNDDFDIEICKKDKKKCLFMKEECMCQSRNI